MKTVDVMTEKINRMNKANSTKKWFRESSWFRLTAGFGREWRSENKTLYNYVFQAR